MFYTNVSFVLHFFLHSTAELKVVLKRKKLAVSGKKSVLLERLKDAFRVQGDHVDQALGLQSYKLLDSTQNEGEENGEENDEENDEDDDDLVIGANRCTVFIGLNKKRFALNFRMKVIHHSRIP